MNEVNLWKSLQDTLGRKTEEQLLADCAKYAYPKGAEELPFAAIKLFFHEHKIQRAYILMEKSMRQTLDPQDCFVVQLKDFVQYLIRAVEACELRRFYLENKFITTLTKGSTDPYLPPRAGKFIIETHEGYVTGSRNDEEIPLRNLSYASLMQVL